MTPQKTAKWSRKLNPRPDEVSEALRPLGRVEYSSFDVHWVVKVTLASGDVAWWSRRHYFSSSARGSGNLVSPASSAEQFKTLEAAQLATHSIARTPGDKIEIVRCVELYFEEVVEPLAPLELLALQAEADKETEATSIEEQTVEDQTAEE